jgi:hypothetical protein
MPFESVAIAWGRRYNTEHMRTDPMTSGEFRMSFFHAGTANRLCLAALLILAIPMSAQSRPLGDLARELRAERAQSGVRPKVWTNEDLMTSSSGKAPAAPSAEGKQDAQEQPPVASPGKAADNSGTVAETGPATKQAEPQKSPQDVNQKYLDKIAGLRTQIAAAQQDLARLQRDQVESTNQFRYSNGTAPGLYEYQSQQRLFEEQIEAQRKLIVELNQQVEDAQEAARHAGVPHADEH